MIIVVCIAIVLPATMASRPSGITRSRSLPVLQSEDHLGCFNYTTGKGEIKQKQEKYAQARNKNPAFAGLIVGAVSGLIAPDGS